MLHYYTEFLFLGPPPVDSITDDLEAELEMDLDNLKLDDIDTTDVNLDDEGLLEDWPNRK